MSAIPRLEITPIENPSEDLLVNPVIVPEGHDLTVRHYNPANIPDRSGFLKVMPTLGNEKSFRVLAPGDKVLIQHGLINPTFELVVAR